MSRVALVAALALASIASCGHAQTDAQPATARRDQGAEELRRDPMKRLALMENMHRQIVYKTRDVPEDRFQMVVRPQLAQQLEGMGLDAGDAERVLRDADYTRGLRNGNQGAPRTNQRTARR